MANEPLMVTRTAALEPAIHAVSVNVQGYRNAIAESMTIQSEKSSQVEMFAKKPVTPFATICVTFTRLVCYIIVTHATNAREAAAQF